MLTLSVLKADIGSIGGHTEPTRKMLQTALAVLKNEVDEGLINDALVTNTGDDVCLTIVHEHGKGADRIHQLAWMIFEQLTEVAKEQGLYGAGQDLLVDAPSGNIRGAGPAVAEIELNDKCGPGAYNLPFYQTFCDPMHNGGLLLNPKLNKGFVLHVIDMDHTEGDRIIKLNIPEDNWNAAALLRDIDRYAIEGVYSRHDGSQVLSASATRLHNISGVYSGKDDPIAIVRVQGAYPAPEEVVEPWMFGHWVTGDCRGSHNMPIVPMPINSPVAGPYCLPIVSAITCSLTKDGKISYVDIFGDQIWDSVRHRITEKAVDFRRQGCFGIAMASEAELAYTGITETVAALDERFEVR